MLDLIREHWLHFVGGALAGAAFLFGMEYLLAWLQLAAEVIS